MSSSNQKLSPELRSTFGALLMLGVLVAMIYGPILFSGASLVLSQPGTDLSAGEADGRGILFEALRQGEIPQWNKHIFSGIPLLPELQSGVFYPLNLFLLPFSLTTALNLHVILHVWLIGAGMFFWTRHRELHPLAAFLAAAVVMFAGPVVLHIYAGHLTNLAAMAWAPFLFLSADLVFANKFRRGMLLGSAVMALQILTGQAQYVFYTGIALGLYSLLRLISETPRLHKILGLAVVGVGACGLSAIQLLPGLIGIRDGVRGGKGVGYEFAAMFSFPPENILTLLVPGFFGDMNSLPYWGRCYLWEMCLFFGATGLVLAIYGFAKGSRSQRQWSGTMVVILFILALGSHTPLFRFLFDYAPGFKNLRGNSKFIFPCLLFAGMLAAAGMNALLAEPRRFKTFGFAVLAGSALVLLAGTIIAFSTDSNWWRQAMLAVLQTREGYLAADFYTASASKAAHFAAQQLFWAAGLLAAVGAISLIPLQTRWRTGILAALAIGEVFLFARHHRTAFSLPQYREKSGQTAMGNFLATYPGDYRILQLIEPNAAMSLNAQNIWGYGAIPSRRYLEFIAFTQGEDPDQATQYVNFKKWPPIYRILRCKFAFVPGQGKIQTLTMDDPLERLQLVSDVEILSGRDAILRRMSESDFDPRKTVILEYPAGIQTGKGKPGDRAQLVRLSRNSLEIKVEISEPSVLLITDPYSKSWQARDLSGESRREYPVMVANYVLMAIPLEAGQHHIILECIAPGYKIGKWITIASLLAWVILFLWPLIIKKEGFRRG